MLHLTNGKIGRFLVRYLLSVTGNKARKEENTLGANKQDDMPRISQSSDKTFPVVIMKRKPTRLIRNIISPFHSTFISLTSLLSQQILQLR
jgi:hypothetical protein